MSDYRKKILSEFVELWKQNPTSGLYWKTRKDEEGFWEMKNENETIFTNIPARIGDELRDLGLASFVDADCDKSRMVLNEKLPAMVCHTPVPSGVDCGMDLRGVVHPDISCGQDWSQDGESLHASGAFYASFLPKAASNA